MQDGMAYVMLSRCASLSDIYILGDFAATGIRCNSFAKVVSAALDDAFDARVAQEEEDWNNSIAVSYLNVRSIASLNTSILEVPREEILVRSRIFALGETCLPEGEERKLPGFHDYYQSNCKENAKGKGLAVYCKEEMIVKKFSSKLGTASAILVEDLKINVISMYLSKGFDWNELQFVLASWISSVKPTVVIGDMNWHFDDNHPMKTYLLKRGFSQLIQRATHEAGHKIDHLYISDTLKEKFTYKILHSSVHFSDHDIIGIQLFEKSHCDHMEVSEK